jgi:signal transduction histidine kinase
MDSTPNQERSPFRDNYKFVRSISFAFSFAAVVHILFAIIFWYLGVTPLFIYNCISPFLYLVAYIFIKKDMIFHSGIVSSFEVTIHSTLATLFAGWDTGFHYYLLLIFIQIFFLPRKYPAIKILTATFLAALYIGLRFYALKSNEFVFSLSGSAQEIFFMFNVITSIAVLSIFSFIYSQTYDKTEKQLRNNTIALEKSNKSKNRFFSILSHDLKNPFNSLIGLTELLEMNFEKYDDKKKRRLINQIHSISTQTYKMLINLLDWSRSQIGDLKIDPEPLNLKQIINDNLELYKSTIANKNIEVELDIASTIPPYTDVQVANTIIRNIISNAVKFSFPGGKIIIRTTTSEDNKFIILKVADQGTGIPAKDQKNLFSLDQSTRRKGTLNETGSGIGLILCKEYIEKTGGRIEVESEENKGTTFDLYIPVK